jgi:hypothetical protein
MFLGDNHNDHVTPQIQYHPKETLRSQMQFQENNLSSSKSMDIIKNCKMLPFNLFKHPNTTFEELR